MIASAQTLTELAHQHGTPLYVYSRSAIESACAELADAFDGYHLAFSVKANEDESVLRLLRSLGWGANVVSCGEWESARRAGFAAGQTTLEGIGKTDRELRAALATLREEPLLWLVLESADEAHRLAELAAESRLEGAASLPVLLRLNPEVEPDTIAAFAVGAKTSKFGLASGELSELAADPLWSTPGLDLRGIHLHIGSSLGGVTAWQLGVEAALAAFADVQALHPGADTIDVGGGYPLPDPGKPRPADFRAACDAAAENARAAGQPVPSRWGIEPGRYPVGRGGVVLGTVLHVRERGGVQQAVIDAGMTEVIRPAMYSGLHPVVAVTGEGELRETSVHGPVCESTDALGTWQLPSLRRGDLLAITDTGAYSASMAMRYNGRPEIARAWV